MTRSMLDRSDVIHSASRRTVPRVESRYLAARKVCSTVHSCFVAKHGFERVEVGVGAQYEDAVDTLSSSTFAGSIAKCSLR
jgi:hypothetical protein